MFGRKRQEPFSSFINRIPDLEFVDKHSERLSGLIGIEFSDLTSVPYQVLKHDIPDLIKQAEFERAIFELLKTKCSSVTMREIQAIDNYSKLKFFFWVQDQYKMIMELERQYLWTPTESRLAAAGIAELDVLGDVNLIDALAQGDILKWNEIRQLPYSMIFDKQLKNVIEARINKRLIKIKQ